VFSDGIWYWLRLMGTKLCHRVFLSLIRHKLGLLVFLNSVGFCPGMKIALALCLKVFLTWSDRNRAFTYFC